MNKTLKLACIAMMTALSIVANFCTIQLNQNNAISFTITICFIAGIYLGVLPAAVIGYCGDLIAHIILPLGPYNWFIALATTLFGVICALIYKLPLKSKLAKLILALLACFTVCSCALNTFGLWLQYVIKEEAGLLGLVRFIKMDKSGITKTFWAYLGVRAPFALLNVVVNGVIVGVLQQTTVLDRLFKALYQRDQK